MGENLESVLNNINTTQKTKNIENILEATEQLYAVSSLRAAKIPMTTPKMIAINSPNFT